MLSRSAQGLYWMGRYLERAQHLCRLLQLQVEALVDRPVREIHLGWSRIYATLNRQPPFGGIQFDRRDNYTLADSYTLAGDLTFERSNPDSVWSCFAQGRENARQMRHRISAEMWICLNLAYLKIQRLNIEDIWKTSPENFYAETVEDIHTFAGVAATTMYRDEGWHFMQLGHHIERAQHSVALFLSQIATARLYPESPEGDCATLLRLYHAFDAYDRKHSVEIQPHQVLDLLATDPLLPNSLSRSLDSAAAELAAIADGPSAASSAAASRLAGRAQALVRHEWPDRKDREAMLRQIDEHCRNFHDRIMTAYIDYSVEDAPVH